MKVTSYILATALWLICALLAVLLLSLLREPEPVAMAGEPAAITEPEAPKNNSTKAEKTINDYTTITTRPLFHSNRKPVNNKPVAAVPEKATPRGSPDFKLIAVTIDGELAVALLRLKNNTVKRVHSGSIIDGWRIKEIRRKSIVVTDRKKDWIITMAKHTGGVPGKPQSDNNDSKQLNENQQE